MNGVTKCNTVFLKHSQLISWTSSGHKPWGGKRKRLKREKWRGLGEVRKITVKFTTAGLFSQRCRFNVHQIGVHKGVYFASRPSDCLLHWDFGSTHLHKYINIYCKGGLHQCKQISSCLQTLQPIFRAQPHFHNPTCSQKTPLNSSPPKIPSTQAQFLSKNVNSNFCITDKEPHTNVFLFPMSEYWLFLSEDIIHVDIIWENKKMGNCN